MLQAQIQDILMHLSAIDWLMSNSFAIALVVKYGLLSNMDRKMSLSILDGRPDR